jgi:EAL domain-containing protein (putative c-di-GMP-specific phosphodiesterase class I)
MRAKNHWKPWTASEERRLVQLAAQSMPPHAIAVELDRSVNSIRNKARDLGVLLPLYNQRTRTGAQVTIPGDTGNGSGRSTVAAWQTTKPPVDSRRYPPVPMREQPDHRDENTQMSHDASHSNDARASFATGGDQPEPLASGSEIRDQPALDRELDELALRTLLDSGGPSIVYQTMTHIETGKVIGAEALSRFPPGFSTREWFELADAVGLGAELEMSAAQTALAAADETTRRDLGWEFVGINLSPQTLRDARFDGSVAHVIGRHVVLEFADAQKQQDWAVLRTHIDRARDIGARIAVNALTFDEKTQLQRLIEVGPDIVKLDAGYTAMLVGNREERGQAQEFLLNCTRSGMFVVGVGVEKADDLDVLRELGVEAAQGYLFGHPQPIGEYAGGDPRG